MPKQGQPDAGSQEAVGIVKVLPCAITSSGRPGGGGMGCRSRSRDRRRLR